MAMFRNMKIGAKLYFLVGFLSSLLIAVGVLGLRGIDRSNASLTAVYDDRLVPTAQLVKYEKMRMENVEELLLALQHHPRIAASKVHEADHPVARHLDKVESNMKAMLKLWEQYMATTLTPEEKQLADAFAAQRAKVFNEGFKPAMSLLEARKFDAASLLIVNKVIPSFDQATRDFHALVQLQIDVARIEKEQALARYVSIKILAVASIVGGILLALGMGTWIIRGITGRLAESTAAISSSATQIAATVTQHERTASQQATAASQTSTTIEELSASSRRSSEQAANMAALAEKAGAATVQGSEATRQAVAAMDGLKDRIGALSGQIVHLGEQTGQIGHIAVLVKDLSAQINMLALNAAVEAARAGEHGKGFAVVASEVRKLADESKKSAEQASRLVADIQKAANSSILMTEEGTRTVSEVTQLAGKVRELFDSLSVMAGSVNENAQQVMLNARQQSAAFTQIVGATNNIAAGARETAAGIGQTKVGVQQLNEAAENLKAIA
ncbi:MAG: methyl-accepting chemotaxis protein [Rhodocyclaceae bacterium]|nr:methyl-accepting chemotaxis protein [Rhodocyclaceae bacterium]